MWDQNAVSARVMQLVDFAEKTFYKRRQKSAKKNLNNETWTDIGSNGAREGITPN